MTHSAPAFVVLSLLLLGAVGPLTSPSNVGQGALSSPLRPLASDAIPLPVGSATHALSPSLSLRLTVALESANSAGLAAWDARVSDPTSPSYHRYLTEAAFLQAFSPAPTERSEVADYLSGFGGQLRGTTADGLGLTFSIPVGGLESALGVSLVSFDAAGATGYTALGTPRLPTALWGDVAGFGGLSNAANPYLSGQMTRLAEGRTAPGFADFVRDSTTGDAWYFGSDYAQAYGVDRLFPPSRSVSNATFPTREAVATILVSGYNETHRVDLPPWDPTAVNQYFNDSFPASWPRPVVSGVPVTVGSVTPPAPGGTNGLNDSTLYTVENSLDLEMAGSLAPGATVTNFYFAASTILGPSANPTDGSIADQFALCLAAALSHNYGAARLAAVTNSYGTPDLNDSLWNQELRHAAAVGVTVVASSGDAGNAPRILTGRPQGQWPEWPATSAFDAYGTVSVGGVSVGLGGAPTGIYAGTALPGGFDSNLTGINSRAAWWDTRGGPGKYLGSEGGVSTVYPEPSFQFRSAAQPAIVNATVLEGLGQIGRAGPDLALAANSTLAYVKVDASGVYFDVLEGTSVASPVLAGELASAAAVAGHPFGYLNPELYRIASYFAATGSGGNPLLDVTGGANFVFAAGAGWDAATGWGELDSVDWLAADANSSIRNYTFVGPTPGLPSGPHRSPGGLTGGWFDFLLLFGIVAAIAIALLIGVSSRPRLPPPAPGIPGGALGESGPLPGAVPGASSADLSYPGSGPPGPRLSGSAAPGPPSPGPRFACPYCGAMRPADAVRCPNCGLL